MVVHEQGVAALDFFDGFLDLRALLLVSRDAVPVVGRDFAVERCGVLCKALESALETRHGLSSGRVQMDDCFDVRAGSIDGTVNDVCGHVA